MDAERLVRRIRSSGLLFREDGVTAEKASRVLGKALSLARKQHERADTPRGLYSGLTRAELRVSRTCETDWF